MCPPRAAVAARTLCTIVVYGPLWDVIPFLQKGMRELSDVVWYVYTPPVQLIPQMLAQGQIWTVEGSVEYWDIVLVEEVTRHPS